MLKKNLVKIGTGLAAVASSFYWGALPALAATPDNLCPTGLFKTAGGGTSTTTTGSIPGCAGFDLPTAIASVISILMFVAFMAALVFLVIGGVKWIISGGDKEGAGKAKETVTAALIGLSVVLA